MFLLKRKASHQSQESKILNLLKKNKKWGVTNYDLSKIALCYTKVISNLRQDGHNIQCVRITKGTFKYYINDPETN